MGWSSRRLSLPDLQFTQPEVGGVGECFELFDTFRKNSGMSSGDRVVAEKKRDGS